MLQTPLNLQYNLQQPIEHFDFYEEHADEITSYLKTSLKRSLGPNYRPDDLITLMEKDVLFDFNNLFLKERYFIIRRNLLEKCT